MMPPAPVLERSLQEQRGTGGQERFLFPDILEPV